MLLQIITGAGQKPIHIDAAQLLVLDRNGTPIVVAGTFGGNGDIKAAHAADKDFNQILSAFGYKNQRVTTSVIDLPGPSAGARLLGVK